VPGVLSPPVAAVQEALARHGWAGELRIFETAVPTAAIAAETLGCDVAAIANSLVFETGGEPLLVLASGARRVDTKGLAARLGTPKIGRATPEFVLASTGQLIGGVAPVGHPRPLRTVIDVTLAEHEVVWAGAGDDYAMFSTSFDELVALTGGTPEVVSAPPAV
jgi:prolyl-tRNA editing enzyme YbaK/EbsC (Cys-tRNA(Pro) deacylase)